METSRSVSVQRMDDSFEHFRAEFTPAATQLKLFSGAQKSPAAVFTWAAPDATHVELHGTLGEDTLFVSLTPIDRNKFLLMNRGFHWVQPNSLVE